MTINNKPESNAQAWAWRIALGPAMMTLDSDKSAMDLSMQNPVPQAHKHGFDGSCAPTAPRAWSSQIGFSVGVFQWIPKSGGKGLKRSAVLVRVKGFVRDAQKVYEKAREICAKLDAGEIIDRKSISVTSE